MKGIKTFFLLWGSFSQLFSVVSALGVGYGFGLTVSYLKGLSLFRKS